MFEGFPVKDEMVRERGEGEVDEETEEPDSTLY